QRHSRDEGSRPPLPLGQRDEVERDRVSRAAGDDLEQVFPQLEPDHLDERVLVEGARDGVAQLLQLLAGQCHVPLRPSAQSQSPPSAAAKPRRVTRARTARSGTAWLNRATGYIGSP